MANRFDQFIPSLNPTPDEEINPFDQFIPELNKKINRFDQFIPELNPTPAPSATTRPFADELVRQLGLTARAGIQGLTAIPAAIANVPAALSNQLLGTSFPEQQQNVARGLTQLGLPEPQTGTERVVQDIGQALVGTGGGVKLAQQAASPIIQALAGPAGVEAGAAIGAAGLGGVAREAKAPLPVQLGLGIAGGLTGAKFSAISKKSSTAISGLFEDISERGIDDVQAFNTLRNQLGDEATDLQMQISGRFEDGKKVAPGLFDLAKERGKDAFLAKNVVDDFVVGLKEAAAEEIDDEATRILQNVIGRVEDLATGINGVKVNDFQTLRRAASKLSTVGGSKGFVGGSVARNIDSLLEDNIDNISGNQDAVRLWKQAISKRAEFGRKFERPKSIASAIGDDTLERVEQNFIGSGPISSKKDLANVYRDTLKAVPKKQQKQTGFLLRQSMVNQMIKRAAKTTDVEDGVSASFMANQLRNLRRDNKSSWNLFPVEEQRILRQLEVELRKETKGGPINKIGKFLFKFLSRATRSNLELPRTIKVKNIVEVDDLIDMTRIKPISKKPRGLIGTAVGIQQSNTTGE